MNAPAATHTNASSFAWRSPPTGIKFVLKGAARLGEPGEERMQEVFRELCNVNVEPDGLCFLDESVQAERIRSTQEYGGVRVRWGLHT